MLRCTCLRWRRVRSRGDRLRPRRLRETGLTLTSAGGMTLDGSGHSVTLDGGDSRQVLIVNGGISFTLKALTIAHGSAPSGDGGGIFNESGATLTISTSTFSGNSAGFGGGIENLGTL